MKKMPLLFYLFSAAVIHFSCTKNKNDSDSKPRPEDAVIGNYLAMNVPTGYITGSVSVSKTSAGAFLLSPGSASLPSFNFQYNPVGSLFVNGFTYVIPKQTSNTILLDSAYLTLYTSGANTIDFMLTSRAAGTSWMYSGVKQ